MPGGRIPKRDSISRLSRARTMSIRVTRTTDDCETVLKIDGRLRREDVGELAKERRYVQGPLVLELSNLQSADAAGVEILKRLASAGAMIRGASPYIKLLLSEKSRSL
jgi:ABC-type transporter Mla MlaB component